MVRLKGETADLHARVEGNLRFATRADYARYLSVMADMHDAYDPLFRDMPEPLVAGRLGKSARARADLTALGATASPLVVSVPRLGRAEALGALYVLEGSSLGGRVLLRLLRERHGPGLPVSYLEGYGAATSSMWRALASALEAYGGDARVADRMVAGASQCFTKHLEAFSP